MVMVVLGSYCKQMELAGNGNAETIAAVVDIWDVEVGIITTTVRTLSNGFSMQNMGGRKRTKHDGRN